MIYRDTRLYSEKSSELSLICWNCKRHNFGCKLSLPLMLPGTMNSVFQVLMTNVSNILVFILKIRMVKLLTVHVSFSI